MKRFAVCAMAAVLAVLAGCGLRLQGRLAMPPSLAKTAIEAENGQSSFVQALRRSLIASGVEVVSDPRGATAVIRVSQDEIEEDVLSVSARNLPREYELTYTVEFSVTANGSERLPEQLVEVARDFTFDETILLAKEREQAILEEALANDLAAIVMRRLSVL